MARDVALLRRARATGESVFSLYSWSRPTLSLGRNQKARGCYDLERMRAMGVDVVRRPTGGRALLHHREVTYSATAPVENGETLRASYERINSILVDGLSRLGIRASAATPTDRAAPPTDAPCFATPARGELITDGRKLVGSAQWREDMAFLQHGSILIDDDQSMIADFSLGSNGFAPLPRAATLTQALGRAPTVRDLADAMFDAVRQLENCDPGTLEESEIRASMLAELPHFQSELWTWRR